MRESVSLLSLTDTYKVVLFTMGVSIVFLTAYGV